MSDAPTIGTSQYDAQDASDLNNFFTSRVEGKNLGFSDEDLGIMKAQTMDQTTHDINESRRLGGAGMLRTGGITTGGTDTMNENGVNSALAFRSSALNDIAIQNANLKQQQQFAAAGGLQSFLNAERSNQFQIWQSQYYPWQTEQMTNMYKDMFQKQQDTATTNAWVGAGMTAAAVMVCWVAAEVFDGWDDVRTHLARHFIKNIGPKWFLRLYMKYGERFAAFIHDKPRLKNIIRPLFELFVLVAKEDFVWAV